MRAEVLSHIMKVLLTFLYQDTIFQRCTSDPLIYPGPDIRPNPGPLNSFPFVPCFPAPRRLPCGTSVPWLRAPQSVPLCFQLTSAPRVSGVCCMAEDGIGDVVG
jgi:hypothetical protein